MDNRLRFLYYSITELRGRMFEGCAGNGKPGASTGGCREANPPAQPNGVTRSEKK